MNAVTPIEPEAPMQIFIPIEEGSCRAQVMQHADRITLSVGFDPVNACLHFRPAEALAISAALATMARRMGA